MPLMTEEKFYQVVQDKKIILPGSDFSSDLSSLLAPSPQLAFNEAQSK